MTLDVANGAGPEREIAKLKKINAALMSRVERAMDQPVNAFSLFETAIGLNHQVRERTQELQAALRAIERSNDALTRAKQQADAANTFKSTFLAFVTHDLLQPLNAGRLALSALSDVPMAAAGEGLVGQVDRALLTLEDLIRTLLDISRLDAGVLRPDIRAFDIGGVLDPLRQEFAPMAAARGLSLTVRPSHCAVLSDPLMLRRILQNLIANALRYTRKGGVLLGCRPRGGALRVEVIDTGPGIPDARREAIFEEFQREEGAGADPAGFGLGLSIVRRLALALDHPVSLGSRLGHGSVFAVSVPRDVSGVALAPAKAAPALQSNYGLDGSSILLIENDPIVAEAMQRLLERWGCAVRTATGVQAARDLARGEPRLPDLIIADLHLDNGESGFDAVSAVHIDLGKRIPALLVTADYSERATLAATELGFEILRKPVKPAELRSLMAYLLA